MAGIFARQKNGSASRFLRQMPSGAGSVVTVTANDQAGLSESCAAFKTMTLGGEIFLGAKAVVAIVRVSSATGNDQLGLNEACSISTSSVRAVAANDELGIDEQCVALKVALTTAFDECGLSESSVATSQVYNVGGLDIAAIVAAIMSFEIEPGVTFATMLRAVGATTAGNAAVSKATGQAEFRAVNNPAVVRVTGSVDGGGNRTNTQVLP